MRKRLSPDAVVASVHQFIEDSVVILRVEATKHEAIADELAERMTNHSYHANDCFHAAAKLNTAKF